MIIFLVFSRVGAGEFFSKNFFRKSFLNSENFFIFVVSYGNLIMLIEQTTTYAYKLKYLENPTFDKVRNLAKKFIDELPKELKKV